MDKFLSSFISFFLTSFLFYSLLLFLVERPSIEFDYESFIEIDLNEVVVEEKKEEVKVVKEVIKEVPKVEEKKEEPVLEEKKEEIKPPIKEESVSEVDEKVEEPKRTLSDLFGKSDVKEITKELTTHKYKVENVEVKQASLDLEKVFKKEKEKENPTPVVSNQNRKTLANQEVENKYLKLLHKMLLASWITKPEDAGKRAQIVFNISADGTFVYYFKMVSSDEDFKSRLQSSLERLKREKLPPNDESIKVTVNFIAKE